jgi:hypothetical protein
MHNDNDNDDNENNDDNESYIHDMEYHRNARLTGVENQVGRDVVAPSKPGGEDAAASEGSRMVKERVSGPGG